MSSRRDDNKNDYCAAAYAPLIIFLWLTFNDDGIGMMSFVTPWRASSRT